MSNTVDDVFEETISVEYVLPSGETIIEDIVFRSKRYQRDVGLANSLAHIQGATFIRVDTKISKPVDIGN